MLCLAPCQKPLQGNTAGALSARYAACQLAHQSELPWIYWLHKLLQQPGLMLTYHACRPRRRWARRCVSRRSRRMPHVSSSPCPGSALPNALPDCSPETPEWLI